MEAFGYDKNDEEYENILNLSQVTLSCNKEKLNKIIDFLTKIKTELESKNINDAHWHYRDYDNSWTEEESDLIIYIDNNIK